MAQPQAKPAFEPPTGLPLVQTAVDANSRAREALTDQVVAHVRALVEAFTSWYNDLAVHKLAKEISGVVQSGQQVMAQHEDAYLAMLVSDQTGRAVKPAGRVVVDQLRKGVSPDQVYARLGEQFRYSRSIGDDPAKALQATVTRASVMAETDITLAARAQAHKTLGVTPLVIGYRRVIRPELSMGGTCGLCIAAADRMYHKKQLLPIHDRCKCAIMPVTRRSDPGDVMNKVDLSQLYADAKGNTAAALKRTRYKITEHGELGPVLVPKKKYSGKHGRPKGKRKHETPDTSAEQIAKSLTDERMLKSLLALPPAKSESAKQYRAEQIARYRKKLGLD